MAIRANHLDTGAVRSQKIWLQMDVMIELNGSRIAAFRAQWSELWMISLKTVDMFCKACGTSARLEVRMALRATCIARGGKAYRSAMVGVTCSARRRECLSRVMQGAVMAGQTFLVDHFVIVKTKRGCVTHGTLLRENSVRRR